MTAEKIENNGLLYKIDLLSKEYNECNQNLFYQAFKKSKLLLPVILKEENSINIIKIADEQGNDYLPVFTDLKNLSLYEDIGDAQVVVFTLTDFIQIMNADSDIKGIAINPFSNNFIVQRKNIRFLEEEMLNIKSGEQLSIGLPENVPRLLENNLITYFEKNQKINSAYLLQIVRRQRDKSLLLVVDFNGGEGEFQRTVRELEMSITTEDIFEVISLDTDFSKEITEGKTPIYNKQ
ncbi:enhanced serine sensitivity protein SseB [Listeria monocytogenes]|uniref:enhanced serine sensitivity protein SseB C-terminal domain-containing protein n=1 Tax=Listeria monocytogenes TaxID=1639 RepID=UPI000BE127F7|nr:enhanced serine sensitivity protein SseB C-terminal domain-containing protein [Listeria monocytogenes]PDK19320.1 enhanced serine sensitivity protein SseB [Listeria monocytogenes]